MLHILGLVESSADYLCIRIQKEKKERKKGTRSEEIRQENNDERTGKHNQGV